MADTEFTELSPTSLQKFVDKKVVVTLSDDRKIDGWVYTVDPVTYCIVMGSVREDISPKDSPCVTFVLGHAVKDIHIVLHDDKSLQKPNFKDIFEDKNCKSYSKEELGKRKARLEGWLRKNRIPIEEGEGDVLCVMGVLWIDPPYEAECCRCVNEVVLNRVQTVIRNIPEVHS